MKMMDKIILYGSGKRCEVLCGFLQNSNIEIVSVLDSNSNKWGEKIEGYTVMPPKEIERFREINLCITVADEKAVHQIREELQQIYHYSLGNEIHYDKLILKAYWNRSDIRQYILEQPFMNNAREAVIFDCCNGLDLGGVEAWTINICGALIKKGKRDNYIISDKGTYHIPKEIKDHIIYIEHNRQKRFSEYEVLSLVNIFVKKLPCKVITSMVDEVMFAAYLVKCIYPDKIKIISVIHNSDEKTYEGYVDFCECPDLYISVSQDIRKDMIQRGIAPVRIYSMTCPFPCEQDLIRTYTEDTSKPIRIGYAGRMDGMENSQKRMDLWLKLIELSADKDVNFQLEMAGDGPVRREMEEYVDQKGLNDRVWFRGRLERSEMQNFWKRQDICVNLADFEGRSISILEAMGNGAVPVVTATSGVREDIADGVNGYIVPIGDYSAAAERIEYLAKRRECLSIMGRRAHDVVYPKSLMEPHLKFWEELLEN